MATSSYVQRRNEINRALRQVRKAYRTAQTHGEYLERALDRVILNKRMVVPATVQEIVNLTEEYMRKVEAIPAVIAAAENLSLLYA